MKECHDLHFVSTDVGQGGGGLVASYFSCSKFIDFNISISAIAYFVFPSFPPSRYPSLIAKDANGEMKL